MTTSDSRSLTRDRLLDYFVRASRPRDTWLVGMEVEKMGRARRDGAPLPYVGDGPSVRKVLEFIQARRGGSPIMEGDQLIGLDADWGTISLEPGGQVEWSSRPAKTLPELETHLKGHLAVMRKAEKALAVRWVEEAVDPDLPLDDMPWMPKARYGIMRPFLGARGRLAHRMMTQTASIQCAFDYSDPADWCEKFRLAALLAPVANALFANSARIDGADTGYKSYRSAIWQETDPARCGLPAVVFQPHFGLEAWLDYLLHVPTIFRHRARGLVPAGGTPFCEMLERTGCDAPGHDDWETHISTIFTEVRAYTYIEVRSADLVSDDRAFQVPTFWTGLLYDDDSRREMLDRCAAYDEPELWTEALHAGAKLGLEATVSGVNLRELAADAIRLSIAGLRHGAPCSGDPGKSVRPLLALARLHELNVD
jgi:glutamate--cysteine ligase